MHTDSIYENYIHTRKLDLNLIKLKNSSNKMYDFIGNTFNKNGRDHIIRDTFTENRKDFTNETDENNIIEEIFARYNLFLYPFPEFYELYFKIREMFYDKLEVENHEESYYIQSWLNFYWKGDFIDWHHHWPSYVNSWHGYYCIDVEPSKTSYRLEHTKKIIDVKNENNLLVLSKSLNDKHRTWPWQHENPRITIAFDIVPGPVVLNFEGENKMGINHWIPI